MIYIFSESLSVKLKCTFLINTVLRYRGTDSDMLWHVYYIMEQQNVVKTQEQCNMGNSDVYLYINH